jgi:response regulator RpfG family c-di-GMP phosphodiesterase/serine/threonine protein kinase
MAFSPAQPLLQDLLGTFLIRARDWDNLSVRIQEQLRQESDRKKLLAQLAEQKLLSAYQAERLAAGTTFGLILGNYRILERLGAGGMGVVFKAEHLHLPRLAAIKVLSSSAGEDPELRQRFFAEMWVICELHHPNIVSALDAGVTPASPGQEPSVCYFAMEYVHGQDLESSIEKNGPLPIHQACDVAYQIASALTAAQKHNLVHRDIKPSNIMLTSEGQAKLLDFGLARHFRRRLTEQGTFIGTIDYIAPEQAHDARAVDIRADIYGLGGTLFWCLTGRTPFPSDGDPVVDLARRLSEPPRSIRTWQPALPAELDAVVSRMMAVNPDDRYATPDAVMRSLVPFLKPESCDTAVLSVAQPRPGSESTITHGAEAMPRVHRVVIVDDETPIRALCRDALQAEGMQCEEAADGALGLEVIAAKPCDLIILDVDLPKIPGKEVLKRLRESPPRPHLSIIMVSGRASGDEMAQLLSAGADDYLAKPLSLVQLLSRVKAALRQSEAQKRSALLARRLLAVNHELEQNLTSRDSDLVRARNALVLTLAELVAYRDSETGAHLVRLQRYSRCLAEDAAATPGFAGQIDENFIRMLECCAPLHDIGKVGIPDHILLKPGKLDQDERIIMQTHTTIGANTLEKVAKQHRFSVAFFQMAIDITRHHHERYDGKGYPDRLAGNDIPLAARIVTLADVYDALRSRRPYKPALSHAAAVQVVLEASEGQFDPLLLQTFERCAPQFEHIARQGEW